MDIIVGRKYSVVICSFNKLNSLKIVAERIKFLSPGSEIILSDDHSTDDTMKWAVKSRLFSAIHFEDYPGVYRLNTIRNEGIKLATNEYVILLDADCFPEDTYFEGHDKVFDKFPKSVSIGVTRKYDSDGKNLIEDDKRIIESDSQGVAKHEWTDCYGGNVAFPKALWNEEKFDESYNGFWGFEDLDIAMRWNRKEIPFYMSSLSCVRHLEHPKCQQAKEAHSGKCRNREKFEKKYGGRFFEKGSEEIRLKKKILICKNVKPLRNGKRNAKDYPYWDDLIKLLQGYEISYVEGEIPLKELERRIINCDFFISIDSFFQHYAWSIGKSGAVIFSVTDPLIFGHGTHLNIIKDRKYLRKNQFLFMEEEPYNIDAFETPENVYRAINSKF